MSSFGQSFISTTSKNIFTTGKNIFTTGKNN